MMKEEDVIQNIRYRNQNLELRIKKREFQGFRELTNIGFPL